MTSASAWTTRIPTIIPLNLGQAGLGLPDRDYYLKDDKALADTRAKYVQYLTDMMSLAGMSDAQARAERVMALETEIAKVQWTRADRRDADKTYNPMTISDLKTMAPDFAWDAFLAESRIPLTTPNGERYAIVAEKTAFEPLAKIFAATPVSTWRDYLTVHYLQHFAPYLPKRFDDRNFAFYGTVLGGTTSNSTGQTRGVRLLNRLLGEALGKLYVARYFPPRVESQGRCAGLQSAQGL